MFEPTEDKNVRIIVPGGCFNKETEVRFKVDKDLANRTKANKELNNIKIATSLHGIEFNDENLEKVQMEIYPDLHKIKSGSLHQKTIEKCKNKLVTDISVLKIAARLHKNGKITDDVLEEIKIQNSEGKKARRLLEEFKDCDMDQFSAMTDALEKENQGHLAQYLKKTMSEMKEEEANMGCDFVGEIDNLQLQVVSSCKNGDWKVMEKKALEDFPDGVVISLPAKGATFDVMGLIVPKDMDNSTICRIADLLYRQSYSINARLIVRQSDEEPTHGFVRCVESNLCQTASDEMKKQGFKKGPPHYSPEFGICDGEEIFITIAGNLTLDSDHKLLRLKFYLNIDSARSTFKVEVYNKKAQSGDKDFSGELKYSVGEKEQSPPRSGTIVLHVPKDEEHHRYAPLTLEVPLKVSAKYLAWRIPTSDKLKIDDFLRSLAGTNSEFRKLNQRAVKEAATGTEREMCEIFVMNWASHRPKSENKVQIISSLLRSLSPELAKEFDQFMKPFSQANGILSNNGIEELGKQIHTKWEILASNLGIDPTDIDAIKIDFHDDVRRAVRMLDQWRLSNSAIERGTNVLSYLTKCMENSKCSQQVLKMIKAQR
ncbi:uncharacterized protein LOC134261367 [Saccostrea cucullata]|uniref:uncharacterized protein LOC134261367 n=1 Tax=Saccostrea cuccullata TaxID=36930 RepID=UPI002ED51C83